MFADCILATSAGQGDESHVQCHAIISANPELFAYEFFENREGDTNFQLRNNDNWVTRFKPKENAITIVDVQGNGSLVTLRGHTDAVHSCAFSKDRALAITTSHDGTVRIWDAQTGRCLQIIEAHLDKYMVSFAVFDEENNGLEITYSFRDQSKNVLHKDDSLEGEFLEVVSYRSIVTLWKQCSAQLHA
jgi:WD40 repeat protein